MTDVNIPADKLAKYLNIAYKQRERAAKKFADDYGPSSDTVKEVTAELAEMSRAITDLHIEVGKKNKPVNK